MIVNEKIRQRFWSKVDIRSDDECWNWTGNLTGSTGKSAQFNPLKSGLSHSAPKTAYMLSKGEIPNRQTVRHLCSNMLCCNANHLVLTSEIEQRFWRKVRKLPPSNLNSGCWEWIGCIETNGYGTFVIEHQTKVAAHRFSLAMATNRTELTLLACHKCDNPTCVNPDHLYWGTSAENNQDRADRNRTAKGTQINTNKLSESQVREIRELLKGSISIRGIAKDYGVSHSTIARIRDGKIWKHLD
ncbi:MAG: HNH endonuclease [Leptolyngbyaceae cyanobacterium CAN_BIN12]|nr:HNH endonuclease [Leptolyngbyaceae cyanobacterium CAN_BIN12]